MFTSNDYWLTMQRLQEIRNQCARDRLAAQASQARASSTRVDIPLVRALTAAFAVIAGIFAKG